MIISWGLSQGIVQVKAMLKRIEIEKKIFLNELLKGKPVYIPKDLSQDHLPQSF